MSTPFERDLVLAAKLSNDCLENLMKAVPWGNTFGLDVALLNETMITVSKVLKHAKENGIEPAEKLSIDAPKDPHGHSCKTCNE